MTEEEINDLTQLLMQEWADAEGSQSNVLGVSYVASWVDLAQAVLKAGYHKAPCTVKADEEGFNW